VIQYRIMERERYIAIGIHRVNVSKRNEHVIKATLATAGAIAGGVVIGPALSIPLGSAALYEVAQAIDRHENIRNGR